MKLQNDSICIEFNEDGSVSEIISPLGNFNLVDKNGFGRFCYTKIDEDASCDDEWIPYKNYSDAYEIVNKKGNSIECINDTLNVKTVYKLEEDSIVITSETDNEGLSEFGFEFNFNFFSKKANGITGQFLPASPYTSYDGQKMYCIMSVIGVGFCAVISKSKCRAWKTDYYIYQHINNFKFLSSLDKLYEKLPKVDRSLEMEIVFAKTIEECYIKIAQAYGAPLACAEIYGTFGNLINVDIIGEAEYVEVWYGDEKKNVIPLKGQKKIKIPLEEYGFYRVVPYGEKKGLDVTVWSGIDINDLYKKSCDSIKKPYHGDYNACEGMVWCWSLLRYMNFYGSNVYEKSALDGADLIIGKKKERVDSATILTYPYNGYPAYHIKNSNRIQEQFFAISILIETYKFTKNNEYLDFAVNAAKCALNTYQDESGALKSERGDYTTVCAPIIPIVDLALLLRSIDEKEAEYFEERAEAIAEYLLKRDMNFPTESGCVGVYDCGYEDGSISCTALSVLYFCYHIKRDERYIKFAKKILDFHDWWITYTPDARLNMSTMRWWETIWEGDGLGHGICGGHAWTIWRSEADFYYGILNKEPSYLIKSWNGFITNFSKIQSDGTTYACYQPDYITCGGSEDIRKDLLTLKGEDIGQKHIIVHGYFKHNDNSLSRYAWARGSNTWLDSAVVINDNGNIQGINCEIDDKNIITDKNINRVIFFGETKGYNVNYSVKKIML